MDPLTQFNIMAIEGIASLFRSRGITRLDSINYIGNITQPISLHTNDKISFSPDIAEKEQGFIPFFAMPLPSIGLNNGMGMVPGFGGMMPANIQDQQMIALLNLMSQMLIMLMQMLIQNGFGTQEQNPFKNMNPNYPFGMEQPLSPFGISPFQASPFIFPRGPMGNINPYQNLPGQSPERTYGGGMPANAGQYERGLPNYDPKTMYEPQLGDNPKLEEAKKRKLDAEGKVKELEQKVREDREKLRQADEKLKQASMKVKECGQKVKQAENKVKVLEEKLMQAENSQKNDKNAQGENNALGSVESELNTAQNELKAAQEEEMKAKQEEEKARQDLQRAKEQLQKDEMELGQAKKVLQETNKEIEQIEQERETTDITPLNRPHGRREIEQVFGPPGSNQVTVRMPAGPDGKMINVTCHKLIADRMKAAFEEIQARGLSGYIDSFDGCYNYRNKRGGSSLSLHSWGIAFDLNASQNPMGSSRQTAGQYQLAQIFAKYGFYQLPNDPMHFQFATGY